MLSDFTPQVSPEKVCKMPHFTTGLLGDWEILPKFLALVRDIWEDL